MDMNPVVMRHRAVTHAGLQRLPSANVPSCGQKKTHTRACNEFQVLMCHHAVRKDTHTLACNEFWLLMCLRAVREGPRDALACKELRRLRHQGCCGTVVPSEHRQ